MEVMKFDLFLQPLGLVLVAEATTDFKGFNVMLTAIILLVNNFPVKI